MSEIKAEAYDGAVKVYTAEEMRSLLGDSLSSLVTLQNIDMVSQSSEIMDFTYFATFPASDIGTGADVSITGQSVFRNYPSVIGGSYLLYSCRVPDLVLSNLRTGDTFQCSMDLDLSFSSISYLQFGCGFAFRNQSGYHLTSVKYHNNYLSWNGVAYESPYFTSTPNINGEYQYCNFNAKVVPDDLNDLENEFPQTRLWFTQNMISYSENTSSTINVGTVCSQGCLVYNKRLYFVILCPICNADSESENLSGPVNKRDINKIHEDIDDLLSVNEQQVIIINNTYNELQDSNTLLDRIIALLTGLIEALNSGQLAAMNATLLRIETLISGGLGGGGSGGGLGGSDIRDLFELDDEDLADIKEDWNDVFEQYFPALYDAEETSSEAFDDLLDANMTASEGFVFSGYSVQNTQIIPSMTIPYRPSGDGWTVVFDTLKVAVNCVITFMFLSGLKHRFDKTVLEDDA